MFYRESSKFLVSVLKKEIEESITWNNKILGKSKRKVLIENWCYVLKTTNFSLIYQ